MYEREKTVVLKTSASLLPNNVCKVAIDGETYVGVIHKDEFNIVRPAAPDVEPRAVVAKVSNNFQANLTILQAKWVAFSGQTVLVLATTHGALFYDWDGAVLLYAHLLPPTPPDTPYAFMRGIAGLESGVICVGVHTGEVVVVGVEDDNMKTVEVVRWHSRPITTLASLGMLLATADDEGHITLAKQEAGLKALHSIDTYGSAVTCLGMWCDWVAAGYLTGHIRIFGILDAKIIAEICGHARGVTGLDIAEDLGMMMTTSEDSFIRVWQLNTDSPTNPVEHKFSVVEENLALCGGVFTDPLATGLVTTGYDRREVICYSM